MKEGKILYDSFNARYLSFKEVAQSFIPNDFFEQLILNNHSLLMGPRGCGKTTLLKMLTPAALKQYQAEELYASISFWGVYIPTDIQWAKQLEFLNREIKDPDLINVISNGTVTLTILQSLCQTFSYILKTELGDYEEKEIELSKFLMSSWKLSGTIIPFIDSVELRLIQTLADLNASIKKNKYKLNEIQIPDIFYFDFFDLVKLACEAFEKITGITYKKWALCFDELEIAPSWLQEQLLESLRSKEQKIIFKLTTAPIVSFFKQIKDDFIPISNPSENNDFKIIKIWNANQKDFRSWAAFCEKLLQSRIRRKFGTEINATDIFGSSDLDVTVQEMYGSKKFSAEKSNFEHNTPSWFAIQELARIDVSFKTFLLAKGIDPKNPVPKDLKQKDEIFRKIKQLVVYRLNLKKGNNSLRSRKVFPLYYGLPLIYELCDGNPRIFIGLVDDLLQHLNYNGKSVKPLSINLQSRIIQDISEKYLMVLSSHPDANIQIRNRNYNINDLLETIGKYFYNKLINSSFSLDPVLSFVIDEELPAKVLQLIELALYLGAIVYLDNDQVLSNKSVFNKRFRLSYILAPKFRLIARDYKGVGLSKILSRANSHDQDINLFNQI